MPNWESPEKVLQTIRSGDEAEKNRGDNRVKINKAANNEPLLEEAEADKLGMKIYNRWGELMGALAHARRQFVSNFMSPSTFFTVSLPKAPENVRSDWGGIITDEINDKMKDGDSFLEYFELLQSKWAAVVSHGIGPIMWDDKYAWLPRFVAVEDLRIPTDTEVSFRNLSWFAVRIPYTPGELSRKAFSKSVSRFTWDKKAVGKILENIKEVNDTMAENNYNFETTPEKFEELRRQNAGYWSGDAMPTINLWHFYHADDDGKWWLKVVPETSTSGVSPESEDVFICQSENSVANCWREILHVQFGDLNNKAPFMFHSVRSLGFALFEPCYWTDYTRCRLLQHALDQFNIMLRSNDPIDRARAQVQVFQNLGILKPGLSIVPANERHQVDAQLVESVMAQTKQLQSEASTAYTQNIDNGTKKEQTAFETGVKVQQTNAMLSGILLKAGIYEKACYKEICRRFCLEKSDDKDVIAFRKSCAEAGIPKEWLDISKWRIEPTTPLGNGNPTMAMVEAENALKLRPLLDPASQAEALHDAAVQMVGSRRARRWVKTDSSTVSNAAVAAANAFQQMMSGMPPTVPEGLNVMEQVQKLIDLSARYISMIQSTTKIPSIKELFGLQSVAKYTGFLIQGMQGDTGNAPKMKIFAKSLNIIENELKKLQQQFQMEMQKNQAQNGNGKSAALVMETKANIEAKNAEIQQKLKGKELSDQQKRRHKDEAFVGDQKRQNLKTVAEIARSKIKDTATIGV